MSGAGCLQALDAVFDLGVLAMVGYQHLDVGGLLVGDEALEAVPAMVGEGELRTGVRALAPRDQRRAFRPALKAEPGRAARSPSHRRLAARQCGPQPSTRPHPTRESPRALVRGSRSPARTGFGPPGTLTRSRDSHRPS